MRFKEFKSAVKEEKLEHPVIVLDPRPEFRNKNVIMLTNVVSEEMFRQWWLSDPRLHVLFKDSSGEPIFPLVDVQRINKKKIQQSNLTIGQYASMVIKEIVKEFGPQSFVGTNIKPPNIVEPITHKGNVYTFSTSDRKTSH